MSDHHTPDHLGEKCPHCGVVHRILESLPDKPLSGSAIDALEDSPSVVFAQGVVFFSGDMASPNAEETTESLVLSTASTTRLLSRYAGTGWVVEQEIEHGRNEDPEQVGQELWAEAAQHLSEAINEARAMSGETPE